MERLRITLQISYLVVIFLQLIGGLLTKQATRRRRKEPEEREMKEKAINYLKAPKMHLLLHCQSRSVIIICDYVNINPVIYQLHWLTCCQYSVIKLRNGKAKTECIAAEGI